MRAYPGVDEGRQPRSGPRFAISEDYLIDDRTREPGAELVVRTVQSCVPDLPVVLLCAAGDHARAAILVRQGAQDYLTAGNEERVLAIVTCICREAGRRAERRAAEIALKTSEARFRSLFERALIGVSLLDVDGRCMLVNRANQVILGYSAEELQRMPFEDYTHPDDLEPNRTLFRELLDGRRDSFTLDKRFIHKNGHVVWGELAVSVAVDEEGTRQAL